MNSPPPERRPEPLQIGSEAEENSGSPFLQVYEGLDYDIIENELYKKDIARITPLRRKIKAILQFLITLVIGIATAALGFVIIFTVKYFGSVKYSWAGNSLHNCHELKCFAGPFAAYTLFSGLLVGVAGFTVSFMEPLAAGSGVPEVKAYLNGIKVPRILRFKTLFTKVTGVIFSICGGVAGGKEEPLIHLGAILAAGTSQGKITSANCDPGLLKEFRSDHEKRDFVSGGVAAGVATAFGAPIGGILFTIEYGASFWNGALTWRTFFCSVIATFIINFLVSGAQNGKWGSLSNPGLIDFGSFKGKAYSYEQFPIFALIGVLGGLIGGAFNSANIFLYRLRMKYIRRRSLRTFEVFVIGVVTAFLSLVVPYSIGTCVPIDQSVDAAFRIAYRPFGCPTNHYNDMATLFFNTQEDAIRTLLHVSDDFSYRSLLIFFVLYLALHCVTYGAFIPCGIFAPCLLIGCVYGRLVGVLFLRVWPQCGIDPTLCSLLGAASMVSGVTRMTIALTAIILEASNNMSNGVPILLVVLLAKWVGDLLNEGLYETLIEIRRIPVLGPTPPAGMKAARASEVMGRPPVTFRVVESVGRVYDTLAQCTHNAFPIVDAQSCFLGMILRGQLITMLKRKEFLPLETQTAKFNQAALKSMLRKREFVQPKKGPQLTTADFIDEYPRYPRLHDVQLSDQERMQKMNLTPYYNPTAFVMQQNAPLPRVFRLFRTLGLRHLPCIDLDGRVTGVITRKDLAFYDTRLQQRQRKSAQAEDSSGALSQYLRQHT